ncbi:MFS transporter [Cuniculiplasma sp. SKW4]|uniref:MFS transporter n=1 Tax=Cuniculiplasma sp. SKW4 TaxID=3400171 RepID=UPI003FD31BBB
MAFSSRNIENIGYLSISTVFFSISWLWLSFTFPLKLAIFGLPYNEIGLIGTLTSFPFIIVSFSFRYLGKRFINIALKVPFLIISAASLILIILNVDLPFYILIIAVTGFFQSMWWISVEIETGLIGKEGNAEKYSAAWSIPSGLFPLFSGVLLQYTGYRFLYAIVAIISIIGFFIQPLEKIERRSNKKNPLRKVFLLPMTFVGIFLGYSTYVLVPYLKNSSYSYLEIGILLAISGVSFAFGSIFAGKIKRQNYKLFSVSASLLASSFLLLLIDFNVVILSMCLFLGGFGGSLGFSKILAYIGDSEGPRTGVFYYETLFSVGYVTGSLAGGALLSYLGLKLSLLIFFPSLAYAIIFAMNGRNLKPPTSLHNVE